MHTHAPPHAHTHAHAGTRADSRARAQVLAVEQLDVDFASFVRALLHPMRLGRPDAAKAAMHRFVAAAGAGAGAGALDAEGRRAGG